MPATPEAIEIATTAEVAEVAEMAGVAGGRGRSMKAIVQEGYGSADALHVRDVPVPELLPGTVLVRMRAASVNALDWHATHGGRLLEIISKLMRQKDEAVRGVDLAGTVEAVGADVTRFRPGDDVFGGAPASFAEVVRAREDRVLAKPADLPFEEAATINVAGLTALQGLRDHAAIKPGQRVLIHGAGGGVGTFAVQIAKAMGASVTAVTETRNLDLVGTLGADEVIDANADLASHSGRYDAVLDIAATRSVRDLRRVLMPNGMFVQVGAAKRGGWIGVFARIANVTLRARVLRQRVTFYVSKASLDDLVVLRDLVQAGQLRPVIDRRYPLADAREAVRYVGTGKARAKVVITG